MAALLTGEVAHTFDLRRLRARRLTDWLQGDWAVLLSDAEDFAPHPSTPPSYLARLNFEFLNRHTKPLVLASDPWTRDESWVRELTGDDSLIVCDDGGGYADLAGHELRAQLARLSRPFALALDARGRIRVTLRYPRFTTRRRCDVREILQMIDAIAGRRDLLAASG
jgi:alkyl hydroperoxide reductase subunit AhpC